MRKFALFVGLALATCVSARGQEVPLAEVFGGYSYLNVDTNDLSSRQSANGWEATVSGNFNHWFAVEGDVAGYYKTILGVSVRDYSYTGGPRFNYRQIPSATLFAHTLVGGDHLSGSFAGSSASQDSLAVVLGGGLEWNVASHWAVRGSGDYVLTRHNILGAQSFTQNNFRASVGIVYLFGTTREADPRVERKTISSQQCVGSSEAASLGIAGCSTADGLRVSAVRPGSPASQAGIVPGDIVTRIDGRPVRSTEDIQTATAANTTGIVRIGYMIQGNFSTEREAKLR